MPSGVFYFNIYTHNAINYHTRQHVGLCVCSVTIYISMLGQKKKTLAIKGCNWNFKSSSKG